MSSKEKEKDNKIISQNQSQNKNQNKSPDSTSQITLQDVINKVIEYLGPGLKYIIMILFCIGIAIMFSTTIGTKPDVIYLRKYNYIMLFIIPTIILIYLFLRKGNSDLDPKLVMNIGGIVVVITIGILISYYTSSTTSYASTRTTVLYSYIMNIILLAILFVGLAIGYKILKNSAKKMQGWLGFFVNFLFFIPCLISDFVDYFRSEIKSAPQTVYILFLIEILLILAYIYVPKILKIILIKNGNTIQHDPVYLNKSKILSNSDIFLLPNSLTSTITSDTDLLSNTFNSNLGLSMWIYVNNMGASKMEKNGSFLFRVASPNNTNGNPSIQYKGNEEWKFTFSDYISKTGLAEDTSFLLPIKSQKWNHIVFNYYENNCDLFVNGNLERSIDLKMHPLNILPDSNILVGDKNGINGAICNIVYYNVPLTKTKITQIYNTYFMKSPPL